MRHRVTSKQFNRDTNHRKALLKNLVRSLIEEGLIVTTEAKAKETKRVADRIIHKAQTDSIATRRGLHRFFGQRDVVNTLVDRVAPAMKDRVSGFTTIAPMGNRRGDNSALFKLELVAKPERIGTLKSGQEHAAKPKTAQPAAKPAPAKKAEKVAKTATKAAAPKKAPAKKAPAKKTK
jgi:large subunit ribosomal protein L17